MPLLASRPFSETVLKLDDPNGIETNYNHILEPEYHQNLYVDACHRAAASSGAFQLGDKSLLERPINRGKQPIYADDEQDISTLNFEGMLKQDGRKVSFKESNGNVCALKSNAIRRGYIDFELARSTSRVDFERSRARAGVKKHDILINSTGDGTIGRVAIFAQDFPTVVDGHISIIRFKDAYRSWYSAAYLLSDEGQHQIYRYINGSSGQVEIYPQDLARLWVRGANKRSMESIGSALEEACKKHEAFFSEMTKALAGFQNADKS